MNNKKIISLMIASGLFCTVFVWQGVEPVITKLGTAGWSILAVCIFAVPVIIGNSEAWRALFLNKPRPSFINTIYASWISTSVFMAQIQENLEQNGVLADYIHTEAF